MKLPADSSIIHEFRRTYPDKFQKEETIFSAIHRGDRIFISTGCGEPQHLVRSLVGYAKTHTKALFDAELFHILTFGVVPYSESRFELHFRQNSFFIGDSLREAVNSGHADYTPVFLSKIPVLVRKKLIPIDVALIQTTLPDENGMLNLGISVDIAQEVIKQASLVIAQMNAHMPWVHGECCIHIDDVDFAIHYDEPLLEYESTFPDDTALKIGGYVARIVEDGSTIQVGYGSIPNAILSSLASKNHLGVHTELLSDALVDLIRAGVVDNSHKSIDRGKAVATFCMGKRQTYEYIHDNPSIELRPIEYTNNPIIIAKQDNMIAINSALAVDLTGQASAESIGRVFYSGIGGQADFMRGVALSPEGKTILVLRSTAKGEAISRIVPFIQEGSGVTLNRGDIHYVVTEYGIAYLQGKNIRERAMELISIAHPKFRSWLIEEAKERALIYSDQAFIPGVRGEYPEQFETYKTTKTGLEIFLRPVKISDEPLLKNFLYSLSDQSLYYRFFSVKPEMPHEFLQKYVVIDYTKEMAIFAVLEHDGREELVGVGRYTVKEQEHTAGIALVVRDDYQNRGIGRELLSYLFYLAKKQGLLGFSIEILGDNKPMLHLLGHFLKDARDVQKFIDSGVYYFSASFRDTK
ncbi:MAG: GNAT family N-acetyltransferase [Desulfomonilia bacterium]